MPRDSKERPSHTYPKEYMSIFQHILQTGKEVVVSNLPPGNTPTGPYTSLRHSMNSWRRALTREKSPLAPDLYGVVGNIEKRSIDGNMQPVLILRKRDAHLGNALAQIPGIKDYTSLPAFDEAPVPNIPNTEGGAADSGRPIDENSKSPEALTTKTLGEIFGNKDE